MPHTLAIVQSRMGGGELWSWLKRCAEKCYNCMSSLPPLPQACSHTLRPCQTRAGFAAELWGGRSKTPTGCRQLCAGTVRAAGAMTVGVGE